MNRDILLDKISSSSEKWDIIIIGGGATGVGTAIEAASRGYKTCLLEQSDFGKGTSSRSTKLIHGGVRYLKQGNISLVLESLKERGTLLQNAPHLVHNLPFVVPIYDWWEGPFYGIGLKLYDMLAGKQGFGISKRLSIEETVKHIPTIEKNGLRGGVIYYDGQFDDARLVVDMVKTAVDLGGTLVNYIEVISLCKYQDCVCGVVAKDIFTGKEFELTGKAVVNAGGCFSDEIRKIDDPKSESILAPSQGTHLVLDRSFLPGDSAIMVPQTEDGRVLFAIPWYNRIILGTTETPISNVSLEPIPLEEEIQFLLHHAANYLTKDPGPEDVLSMFAGIRPLVSEKSYESTATISRDHSIVISRSGLVTIAGGKWTTYRTMAEDTVDNAAGIAQLESKPSVTSNLQIHGACEDKAVLNDFAVYGSDAALVKNICNEKKNFNNLLHPSLGIRCGEVIWAVRNEMAQTVEDFLSRRTRALILDAKASIEMAPKVAELMAKELKKNRKWKKNQIQSYTELAEKYTIS